MFQVFQILLFQTSGTTPQGVPPTQAAAVQGVPPPQGIGPPLAVPAPQAVPNHQGFLPPLPVAAEQGVPPPQGSAPPQGVAPPQGIHPNLLLGAIPQIPGVHNQAQGPAGAGGLGHFASNGNMAMNLAAFTDHKASLAISPIGMLAKAQKRADR